jgi:hypothetical protein
MERPLLCRRGHKTLSLWATSFLFWSLWGNQASSAGRVTPDKGRCRHSGLVPSRHRGRSFILSATPRGHWDTILGSWWAALTCGTRPWWPCPCREPVQRCGMEWEWRLQTDWTGRWKLLHLSHASPHTTASEWVYLEGRFERPILEVGWGGSNQVRRGLRIVSL